MTINRANQAWALDTTYIPVARGFAYLTAVVDWASRKALAVKVVIRLEAPHALDVLEHAFAENLGNGALVKRRFSLPEIV